MNDIAEQEQAPLNPHLEPTHVPIPSLTTNLTTSKHKYKRDNPATEQEIASGMEILRLGSNTRLKGQRKATLIALCALTFQASTEVFMEESAKSLSHKLMRWVRCP